MLKLSKYDVVRAGWFDNLENSRHFKTILINFYQNFFQPKSITFPNIWSEHSIIWSPLKRTGVCERDIIKMRYFCNFVGYLYQSKSYTESPMDIIWEVAMVEYWQNRYGQISEQSIQIMLYRSTLTDISATDWNQ